MITAAAPTAAPIKTFEADSLPVRVYTSQADLSQDVARIAQAYLKDTLATRGSASAGASPANA